jgi:curved DNA-binding protein
MLNGGALPSPTDGATWRVGSGQPFLCCNLPRFDRLLGTDHPCVLNQKQDKETPMALQQTFIDHYEILQISPKAGQETIERIYRFMAKKYHPDNQATGNAEKFNLLTTAYKTLAHPEKRAAYDATYESSKNRQWQSIAEACASEGYESDQHIRRIILSILYTQKRAKPSDGGVGIVQLETIMQWPAETLDFHIWYLKEKKMIQRTENGEFGITADGVDKIEAEGLVLRKDRLLTEPKGSSEDYHFTPLLKTPDDFTA